MTMRVSLISREGPRLRREIDATPLNSKLHFVSPPKKSERRRVREARSVRGSESSNSVVNLTQQKKAMTQKWALSRSPSDDTSFERIFGPLGSRFEIFFAFHMFFPSLSFEAMSCQSHLELRNFQVAFYLANSTVIP